MRIGAYQFKVIGDIEYNFSIIKRAIYSAVEKSVRVLVFPECALTGYPPRDMESSMVVDFMKLEEVYKQLQELSNNNDICIIVGSIIRENDTYFNSAVAFCPYQEKNYYYKRALWGWDKDNFSSKNSNGIINIDGWKFGIRICFEVRFPEFFRELYSNNTDLNIILFYDVSDCDDKERYDLIKAHIRTRAVENVTYTLSVDAVSPYQTAPTVLFDRSGYILAELERNDENMLIYDLEKTIPDFGENGRIEISDWLTKNKLEG